MHARINNRHVVQYQFYYKYVKFVKSCSFTIPLFGAYKRSAGDLEITYGALAHLGKFSNLHLSLFTE